MEMTVGVCLAWVLGVAPLVGWLLWWWNEIRYGFSAKVRCSAGGTTKLPPGHMGLPLFGEMRTFLWYFKVVRRPNDYINSKRQKYVDGTGMYRTHLFGSPAIIAYTPSINKFILQSESNFKLEWPSIEILGTNSLVAVEGASHSRLKGFVSRAINQPDALRRVALMIQPRVAAALQSWFRKGRIIAFEEAKKVVEETIRLVNVAAIVFRTAIKDVEYKGHKIPKGWKAICWLRYLHTHAENFEDPMCFNPERWNEMAKPGTYQVFGGGSRICAGNMLARLQLAIILHHLVVGYKWELVNPNPEMSYLSHPKPVDGVEIFFF